MEGGKNGGMADMVVSDGWLMLDIGQGTSDDADDPVREHVRADRPRNNTLVETARLT